MKIVRRITKDINRIRDKFRGIIQDTVLGSPNLVKIICDICITFASQLWLSKNITPF